MKYIFLSVLIITFQWPGQSFGEGPLDAYKRLTGTAVEEMILSYARSCIIHKLVPETPKPDLHTALDNLPPVGLYVSLVKGRKVRVCVGSFSPLSPDMKTAVRNMAEEVVYSDTRTRPLSLEEMRGLFIVLSFVGPLREIQDPRLVDFTQEGLYVSQNGRGSVLLPGETRTLDYGLRRMIKQNGLDPKGPFRYAAFKVVVFDERRY